ncbi:MAG: conjugative transposon protein TraM [Bacteroidota bacterium]|nr:conjugative transposon protein TraM [Bacteroidota bacterium]
MKINFKQPKYVLPLIILPFLIFGFFLFGGKMKAYKKDTANEKVEGFNTNMPGVDTNITKGEIKDKFSAYQEAFKNVTDQSAMGDIDQKNTGVQGLNYESSYSSADKQRLEAQRKMDSLNKVLHIGQSKIQNQIAQYDRGGGIGGTMKKNPGRYLSNDNSETGDPLLNKLLKIQQQDSRQQQEKSGSDVDPGSYDSQMHVFREQMKYMDSVQQTNGGSGVIAKNAGKNKSYTKNFNPNADTSFKPLHITATSLRKQNVFNTVQNFNDDDDNIAAMIDQDVKATLGSRVRIRLLKDMYVGDYLIKRGTYIYGVATGFQKQRVNISIAQVLYNNTSLPVKIDLFDNDGYLGLYVPGSNFREFSKEIGTQATQGLSQVATPDNSNVKTNLLSQVFNTTTTTLSNLIRKDKAFLKYNYIVYLKENKTSSND